MDLGSAHQHPGPEATHPHRRHRHLDHEVPVEIIKRKSQNHIEENESTESGRDLGPGREVEVALEIIRDVTETYVINSKDFFLIKCW